MIVAYVSHAQKNCKSVNDNVIWQNNITSKTAAYVSNALKNCSTNGDLSMIMWYDKATVFFLQKTGIHFVVFEKHHRRWSGGFTASLQNMHAKCLRPFCELSVGHYILNINIYCQKKYTSYILRKKIMQTCHSHFLMKCSKTCKCHKDNTNLHMRLVIVI